MAQDLSDPPLLADIDVLRGIIDTVPHPIFVKDAHHRFRLVNQAMCTLMGRSYAELLNRTDYDFVPEEQADLFRQKDRLVLESGDGNENEEPFTDAAGVLHTVVARKRRLTLADGSHWLIGCLSDITEFRRAEALIRHNAEHDVLTGLANRVLFGRELDATIAAAAKGKSAALLLVDLDGFKTINDLFGHAAGDSMLMQTAAILMRLAGPDDLVARLGGDEFAILKVTSADADSAATLAEMVIAELSPPMLIAGNIGQVTASVGIADISGDGDAEQVMRRADLALYRAKKDGRNLWRRFEAELEAAHLVATLMVDDLRTALARGQLTLAYQPFVRARDLGIVGFEALARWHHPTRGTVSPVDFVPMAERSGVIISLGEWVFRTACAEAVLWPGSLRLAINVSPLQFAEIDVCDLVRVAVSGTGIDPRRIDIEITETAVIRDVDRALRIFGALREIGVQVVLDDFGVGYSSLQILKSLPFSKVKVDRSLLQDVGRTPEADALIGAVLRLVRTLNRGVTVEGVETVEQLALLRREGCDELQGFLFGKPRPSATEAIEREFQARLRA